MLPVCVREVTTAGNKHILSLYTISILFPVQKTPVTERCCLTANFFLLVGSVLMAGSENKFHGQSNNFWGVNCSHYSQHYLAGSELFCKVVPRQLRLQARALSLSCISRSLPSDGSPLMPFSDVDHMVAGEGCVSGPLVSERYRLQRTPRGLPVSILSLRSHYNDFQWHQFDLKY